jgi:hypothetical protein
MERSLYSRDGDTNCDGDSNRDPNTNSLHHAHRDANHLSDRYSIAGAHQYTYVDTNSDPNRYSESNSHDLADGNRDSD